MGSFDMNRPKTSGGRVIFHATKALKASQRTRTDKNAGFQYVLKMPFIFNRKIMHEKIRLELIFRRADGMGAGELYWKHDSLWDRRIRTARSEAIDARLCCGQQFSCSGALASQPG